MYFCRWGAFVFSMDGWCALCVNHVGMFLAHTTHTTHPHHTHPNNKETRKDERGAGRRVIRSKAFLAKRKRAVSRLDHSVLPNEEENIVSPTRV